MFARFAGALGGGVYQTYFTSNLPKCSDIGCTETGVCQPCKSSTGTILFLFQSCDQVSVGTPCFLVLPSTPPAASDLPDDQTVADVQDLPDGVLDQRTIDEVKRRDQIRQLKKWGVALGIGTILGGIFAAVRK